jgi:ubiquinone/menaquinone biosynthesis C-methylase UbiE
MGTVNARFGGIQAVRHFVAVETKKRRSSSPMRILDIGSGSCDIPLAVSRWARSHDIPLHFTCLEMSDHAYEIARVRLARANDRSVTVLKQDVFSYQPVEHYDCAVASMCFHHFSNEQILALIQRLAGFVRGSLLINDLRRSFLAWWATKLLLAFAGAPAGVRHDALISIRRGFKADELRKLVGQLPDVTFSAEHARWFRIAAVVHFQSGDDA